MQLTKKCQLLLRLKWLIKTKMSQRMHENKFKLKHGEIQIADFSYLERSSDGILDIWPNVFHSSLEQCFFIAYSKWLIKQLTALKRFIMIFWVCESPFGTISLPLRGVMYYFSHTPPKINLSKSIYLIYHIREMKKKDDLLMMISNQKFEEI